MVTTMPLTADCNTVVVAVLGRDCGVGDRGTLGAAQASGTEMAIAAMMNLVKCMLNNRCWDVGRFGGAVL